MSNRIRQDQSLTTAGLGAATLLDQLATAVLVLDGGLRMRYLNSATEMLFGASARRLVGTPLPGLVTQGESLAERLLEALGSEAPHRVADGLAAESEFGGHGLCVHMCAGGQPAGADLLQQVAVWQVAGAVRAGPGHGGQAVAPRRPLRSGAFPGSGIVRPRSGGASPD